MGKRQHARRTRGRRANRRYRRDAGRFPRTPWILREYYGAPVWGIIVFCLVVAAIGVFALLGA